MQNGGLGFAKNFLWHSLVTVLHTYVSIMLKLIRTTYRYFRTAMLKHSVRLPIQCFQFRYVEFRSN